MERTTIIRLIKWWLRDFGFLVPFNLTTKNTGGSAICIHRDTLPEEAVVTHWVIVQAVITL